MRSKMKLALAGAGVIAASAAIATSFEGRLVCDQDPRFANAASCILDRLTPSESSLFGWGDRLRLTLQGPASEELAASAQDAQPEMIFFTQYAVDEATGDVVALHDASIANELAYLVDENTGDVVAIRDGRMPGEFVIVSSLYVVNAPTGG